MDDIVDGMEIEIESTWRRDWLKYLKNWADVIGLEQKLPIVGDYFIRETPASDNVSACFRLESSACWLLPSLSKFQHEWRDGDCIC